jgi:hypothetical protein
MKRGQQMVNGKGIVVQRFPETGTQIVIAKPQFQRGLRRLDKSIGFANSRLEENHR